LGGESIYISCRELTGTRHIFRFKKPIRIAIQKEKELLIGKVAELGIVEYGKTLNELLKSIGENLEVFYEEASTAELSASAKRITDFLSSFCVVVPR